MRKIILSINVTEDGFIAGPNGELDWHFPFWDEEMSSSLGKLLHRADTILLGRKTYNALEAYWSNRTCDFSIARQDIAIAEMMNRYTKVVASKTLRSLSWRNSFVLSGNVNKEIAALKTLPGNNIIVLGSCSLVSYLMERHLVDEFHLWVHPITIRKGIRLRQLKAYRREVKPVHLDHLQSGVMKIVYSNSMQQI